MRLSSRPLPVAVALAGACFLAGSVLLVVRLRSSGSPPNPHAPAPPARPGPDRSEPGAVEPRPPDPGRTRIRLRWPDGRIEVVEETPARTAERQRAVADTRALLEQAQDAFHSEFLRLHEKEGAGAAVRFLEAFVRDPREGVEDLARVAKAIEISAALLGALGDGSPETKAFEQFRSVLSSRLRSVLASGNADGRARALAAGHLARLPAGVAVEEAPATLEEGLPTYDLGRLVSVYPVTGAPDGEWAGSGGALAGDDGLADVLEGLARNATLEAATRTASLRALVARPDVLSRIPLADLACRDPDQSMRRTAVDLLARDPKAALSSGDFFSILGAQPDSQTGADVLRKLGPRVPADAALTATLNEVLAAPPEGRHPRDPWKDALFLEAALQVGVEAYVRNPADHGMFALLTGHLEAWAARSWTGSSPVLSLAERASARRLREFVPALEGILPVLKNERERVRLREILETFGP